MDDVMRVACLTLLRHANVTLQHIPPLLNSAQFRAAMTADLDDPEGLSGFWQWYDEMTPALRSQVIGPVLARLRSFLLRDFVKQTMGYPHSSFDMGKVLDGGVLLARLPKGALGEDTTRLMGSLILARCGRPPPPAPNIPADRRRDATSIIDESQNFLTLAASLDTMLAEARKYRLSHGPGPPGPGPVPARPARRGVARTPATSCTSPAHPRTPASWPGTPCPNSTNTT